MKRVASLAAALLLLPLLSACGLQPVYSSGTHGKVAQAIGHVEVAPIEGKAGWLVRNALTDRLAAVSHGSDGPNYRLTVTLDDQITGFGVRLDDAVTRERRTLRARYQLVDSATGMQLLDKTAGSDAGLDVAGSEYATIAAENTALERLSEIIADQIIAELSQRAATQPQ
jgi:LPS-assembly lipoprotein